MSPDATPLEIWGGLECSLNRTGSAYRDQTRLSGHHDRPEDINLFAALGLKALRYPVLWERVERRRGRLDWSWTDERLALIRNKGMRVVAGLLHHGSGPPWTDILDTEFAPQLARFAREAARRYPWIQDWTPVNEPLTTARFSALYGLWHPHASSEKSFWTALLNQIDAVRLSMREIRRVIPDARLIQTEDFGHTFATPPCQQQADFENQRRLMTWDLLCGHVGSEHPLHSHLCSLGLAERLAAIASDPCRPVIGLNHYLTSDRLLDHRLDHYPPALHGGNGGMVYADVEAVRVVDPPPPGWRWHLDRLWKRYGLPIVVTECHLGCTREEQLRWLNECWTAAISARASGALIEAVTVWNLLGGYDWNSLLTRPDGVYESGVFDLSEGSPRPTALAALVRNLAYDGAGHIPLAREMGWWRRPHRLLYPSHQALLIAEPVPSAPNRHVIFCALDALTDDLEQECARRGLQLSRSLSRNADQPWTYTASAAPTARTMDLLIDRWLVDSIPMPATGHRDTDGLRRI